MTVYVTARKDGTVEIAKRTFTVPPGITLDAQTLLQGTILQPGKNLADEVSVPLPLSPLREYLDPADMSLPNPVKKVVFCLGVTRQDAFPEDTRNGVDLEDDGASPSPSKDGPLFTHPSSQHLFCSATYRLDPPT